MNFLPLKKKKKKSLTFTCVDSYNHNKGRERKKVARKKAGVVVIETKVLIITLVPDVT